MLDRATKGTMLDPKSRVFFDVVGLRLWVKIIPGRIEVGYKGRFDRLYLFGKRYVRASAWRWRRV